MLVVLNKTFYYYVVQYFQRMGDYSQLWEKQKKVGADLSAN